MDARENELQDNIVTYHLYPVLKSSTVQDEIFSYLAFLNSKFPLKEHIWQHEPIRFWSTKGSNNSSIMGWVKYGDNIEDEWLIVFLLFELTKHFKDLIVSVNDDDGEFLLIEAADHLPKGLDPESSENRVFLYKGELHIVPKSFEGTCTEDALHYVRSKSSKTVASSSIQNVIKNRISGYPENITKLMHRAHAYLPRNLSVVLFRVPSLISSMVETFCLQDVDDIKACLDPKYFRLDDLIKTSVVLNRCQYAQMMNAKCVNSLPYKTRAASSHVDFAVYDLGFKLTLGAEILCNKGLFYKRSPDDNNVLEKNKKWQQFLQALNRSGYFKDELVGSKEYNSLLTSAKSFFKSSANLNDENNLNHPGVNILNILQSQNLNEEIKQLESQILFPADDDSWMNIGPNDLDKMLLDMFPKQKAANLDSLGTSLQQFMAKMSGLEGVDTSHNAENEIELDPDKFMDSVQKLLDEDDDDDDNDDDDDSSLTFDDCDNDSDDLPEDEVGTEKQAKRLRDNPSKMKEYMDEMDRQLAATEIGKSFLKNSDKTRLCKQNTTLLGDFNKKANRSNNGRAEDLNASDLKTGGGGAPGVGLNKASLGQGAPDVGLNEASLGQGAPGVGLNEASLGQGAASVGLNGTGLGQNEASVVLNGTKQSQVAASAGTDETDLGQCAATVNLNGSGLDEAKRNIKMDKSQEFDSSDLRDKFEPARTETEPDRTTLGRDENSTEYDENRFEDMDDNDVNVDLNLVKNFLESFSEQCGMPGPVSNILHGMGIRMPNNE